MSESNHRVLLLSFSKTLPFSKTKFSGVAIGCHRNRKLLKLPLKEVTTRKFFGLRISELAIFS